MEENNRLQIERIDDSTKDLSSTRSFSDSSQNDISEIKKDVPVEEKNKEEEKKVARSRLFILFIVLDVLLAAFVIVELVLLFVNVATNGIN